jgi:hypothetical protein
MTVLMKVRGVSCKVRGKYVNIMQNNSGLTVLKKYNLYTYGWSQETATGQDNSRLTWK